MMKTNVYGVFDSKANAYLQPFFANTDGLATRSFIGALTDENHAFCKHSADYTLFRLGDFDDEQGILVACEPLVNLGNGLQLKNSIAKDYLKAAK